ncbi:hypothetical protein NQ317_019340 [Molorchus minor]|uniref:Microsomal glutathione S-transferase 1 n=1 Tax=Molorchus minor TaxID=1323400 RepID=A0ABQ9J1S1_9CUCU|nr:hypothetical protein NQ317_019340 [Molorchus minor]
MAQVVTGGLSVENPLFRVYLFYSSVLVLKMLFMSAITGMTRVKIRYDAMPQLEPLRSVIMSFANPEDAVRLKGKVKTDEEVERKRRAHLNDLENIPIFLIVSAAYILTEPSVVFATLLFRAFTIARIVHTLVYAIVVVPQPARGISFGVGLVITAYMAIVSLLYFL